MSLTINNFRLIIEKIEIVDISIGTNRDGCNMVELQITDSTMLGISTVPGLYGSVLSAARVILSGCNFLNASLENSRFTNTDMAFAADEVADCGLNLSVMHCEFTMTDNSIVTDPKIHVFFSVLSNSIVLLNTSFHSIRFTGSLGTEKGVVTLMQDPTRLPPAPPSEEQSKIGIVDCTFERNQARAVYVLAATLNVTMNIQRTMFLHNSALGAGAALSVVNSMFSSANSRVIFRDMVSVTLIQSTFQNNTSIDTRQGGESLFLSFGLPVYGNDGAIYTVINATLHIRNCIFLDNVAESLGGAIYNERYSALILTNTSFQKTSPPYAFRGDFIFAEGQVSFEKNNTFLANASLPGECVIEFNSAALDWNRSLGLVSPNTYAYLINLQVFCPVGSSTDVFLLEFNFGGNSEDFRVLEGAASRFVVSCVPCESSQYTMQQGRLDFNYHQNVFSRYNLHRVLTVDNITCHPCPYGAACRDGQVMALQDFWGYVESDGSISFLQCAAGHCCQSPSECTSYDSCMRNRTGVLCGQCQSGFQHALFTTDCVRDANCNDYWIFVVIVVVALFYVLFLMYVGDLLDTSVSMFRWIAGNCCGEQQNKKIKAATKPAAQPSHYQLATISTEHDQQDPIIPSVTRSDQQTDRTTDQATQEYNYSNDQLGNVAHVIRRAQGARESLFPPSDPNDDISTVNTSQSHGSNEVDVNQDRGSADTGYLGILVYFFQTVCALNTTVIFTNRYQEERLSVSIQDGLEKVFNFRITELAADVCIPGLSEVTKLLFIPCYVVFLYIILLLMLVLHKMGSGSSKTTASRACCMRSTNEKKCSFKTRLIYGMTELLIYSYGLLAETTFTYLTCVSVAGQHVWQSDGSHVCLQPWQWAVVAYAVVYTVPFCMGLWVGTTLLASGRIGAAQFVVACFLPLPMLLYWFAKWATQSCLASNNTTSKTTTDSAAAPSTSQQPSTGTSKPKHTRTELDILKTLQGPYRDVEDHVTIYWEAVMEVRRLIISALILIPNDVIRLVLATVACNAFLIHHNTIQPFKRVQSNIVETISLLGLCIVSITALLQATFTELEAIARGIHVDILNAMQWISSVMGFVVILSILLVEVIYCVRYSMRKRKLENPM